MSFALRRERASCAAALTVNRLGGAAALVFASSASAAPTGKRPTTRMVGWDLAAVQPSLKGLAQSKRWRWGSLARALLSADRDVEPNEAFTAQRLCRC